MTTTRRLAGIVALLLLVACNARDATPPASSANAPAASQELGAAEAEAAIRAYYKNLKEYNFDAMRAAVTPDFEITYAGLQLSAADFEKRHREEEKTLGPTASRPERMQYQLVDFKIEAMPEVAISSSRETQPGTNSYSDLIVLKRSGNQWLIHRFFHMAEQPPAGR